MRPAAFRMLERAGRVRDTHLFLFTVAWVIAGGLALQLVVLPYLIPSVHWGHGLITDLDSPGYHIWAVNLAADIEQRGWSAWQMRPMGHFMTGAAAVFYTLLHPEPWTVLPFNGVLFAAAVVAARRTFATIVGSDGVALIGVAPFFLFVSFVPIWGQLQKDVVTGAGLCVVVCGVVLAGRAKGARAIATSTTMAIVGVTLIWLPRPYAVVIAAAAAVLCGAAALLRKGTEWKSIGIAVPAIMLSALMTIQPWQLNGAYPMNPDDVVGGASRLVWSADWRRESAERARVATERINLGCAPPPSDALLDRLMFSLCSVRSNFIANAERAHAASGYDYGVRLRTVADFMTYAPVAMGYALFAPWPGAWGNEQTPIGRLASVFVPVEMLIAYAAFALAIVGARRNPPPVEAWGIALFALAYGSCFALATPQLGTLYRMRAFPFAMLVGTALCVWLRRRDTAEKR